MRTIIITVDTENDSEAEHLKKVIDLVLGLSPFTYSTSIEDEKYQSMAELSDAYDEIPEGERNSWEGYVEQMAEAGLVGFEVKDSDVKDYAPAWEGPL